MLVASAVAGQILAYMLTILLARKLTVEDFEAYVVAAAAFVMLATFAPRGAEKHLLLRLPAMIDRGEFEEGRRLLGFGVRRTVTTAIAAATIVGGATMLLRDPEDETRAAIIVSCLSLPAGALVHLGVEALTASGRPLKALLLFRMLVPSIALMIVLCLLWQGTPVRGAAAVGAWGVAWLVALLFFVAEMHRAGLSPIVRAGRGDDLRIWKAEARPFFVYRVSLALLAQAGIVALDLLNVAPAAVGAYAAAMGTVSIAAVLATSTNRAYSRELALLLDRRDFTAMLALRRARLRWVAPSILLFLAAAIVFPAEILELFRPEFAREGVTALRLLAAATGFMVIFSLAPTYLKYRGRNRLIYAIVAIAAFMQVTLLVILIPAFGVSGAAGAYAVSMCGMYLAFAIVGHKEVARLRGLARSPSLG